MKKIIYLFSTFLIFFTSCINVEDTAQYPEIQIKFMTGTTSFGHPYFGEEINFKGGKYKPGSYQSKKTENGAYMVEINTIDEKLDYRDVALAIYDSEGKELYYTADLKPGTSELYPFIDAADKLKFISAPLECRVLYL